MKRSMNEINGLVLKAARGAGVPLGHCEDIASAAAYLAATDPTALECLPDVLCAAQAGPVAEATGTQLRIKQGAMSLIAPVCVDALKSGYDTVIIENCEAHAIIFALCAVQDIGVDHAFEGMQLTLTRSDTPVAAPAVQAVTVSQALWDALGDLAAKTYVPATEASRLAGAGAGLTDND